MSKANEDPLQKDYIKWGITSHQFVMRNFKLKWQEDAYSGREFHSHILYHLKELMAYG